jgi:hypothetical protein
MLVLRSFGHTHGSENTGLTVHDDLIATALKLLD